jgi:hypothetical protein
MIPAGYRLEAQPCGFLTLQCHRDRDVIIVNLYREGRLVSSGEAWAGDDIHAALWGAIMAAMDKAGIAMMMLPNNGDALPLQRSMEGRN